jgi:predicted permease
MIQRLQSLYLLLASLAIFALFIFPIAHNVYIGAIPKTIKVTGIYEDIAGQMQRTVSFLALTIVTVIMGILPLIILMRYKNRKQQMALCWSFIFVLFGFSFWMSQTVQNVIESAAIRTENFGIGALLSSISIVFVLLAIKGIKNDEKLVKSADRLR